MPDELKRYVKKLLIRMLLTPLRLLKVKKNRVFLINNLSHKFAGNPKYVAQYLMEHYGQELDIVISVKRPEDYAHLRQQGFTVVRFNSLQYFVKAMTSKVFLTNSGGYSYLPLKKKQFVINTWHGGAAYKKCGTDMYSNSPIFRADLKLQGRQTGAFLSTCSRFTEEFSRALIVPKAVFWGIGMPRNDLMLHPDEALRRQVRARIGLAEDEKLVLFAPTYRKVADNYFRDSIAISYGLDSDRVVRALEKRFGGKWRFAVRYHPNVVNRQDVASDGVLDLTDYEDMQELLLAADAMINDFSSSLWDYMLTGKPCFLFAVDLEHYVATTEVYTPVSQWPYPQAVNNDQLEKNILEFSEENYAEACTRHYEALGGCETGEATGLVGEKIYRLCTQ
ncbi:MAG: CDP-glycerol glycerophosphotransferase family protein [Oscillospiraceae bacterium]|nr:CDP-glycerol glycerophosphotransferase family protein [Oscillospiraceae bacterium]